MAYSNWGAKVYIDGKAAREYCDVTVQQVLENSDRQWYMLNILDSQRERNKYNAPMHAVVGDKDSGVLVALYKSYPAYIFDLSKTPPKVLAIGDKDSGLPYGWEESREWYDLEDWVKVEVNGITVELKPDTDGPESMLCKFTDKLGRKWDAVSGYCLGEGWEDWD